MKTPSLNTISRLLKREFKLSYRAASPALTRYLDPSYNPKRVWVSRLLAQFVHEGALVISLDESNFRSDSGFKAKQWRFTPKVANVSQMIHGLQLEEERLLGPL